MKINKCLHCEKELERFYKSDEIPGVANNHYIVCPICGNVMIAEMNGDEIIKLEQTPVGDSASTKLMIAQFMNLCQVNDMISPLSEERLVIVKKTPETCEECTEQICTGCPRADEIIKTGEYVQLAQVECGQCSASLDPIPVIDKKALEVIEYLTDPQTITALERIKAVGKLQHDLFPCEMDEDDNPIGEILNKYNNYDNVETEI